MSSLRRWDNMIEEKIDAFFDGKTKEEIDAFLKESNFDYYNTQVEDVGILTGVVALCL
jgi:hypothetical protein